MSTTEISPATGSHVAPSFAHARVADAMRHGVITCPPETPLVTVARMMASYHVHAIVVTSMEEERDADIDEPAWGVVSDRELLRYSGRADEMSAGGAAVGDFACVTEQDSLEEASRRMLERGSAHALVVGERSRRPLGMISSLDVAGVIAWGRA
jgi:CBS domain-containing protein